MTVLDDVTERVLTEADEPAMPCDGPCDPEGEPKWWVRVHDHTPCYGPETDIGLLCTPCKEIALSPDAYFECDLCHDLVLVSDCIIDWGPL